MKSFLLISFLLILLSNAKSESESFKEIIQLFEQYHNNTPEPHEFEYIIRRVNQNATFRLDNSSTQKIEDIVKQYNLPLTMKSVLQEIYLERDDDEVYEKLINFKESLGEINVTYYYLIHKHILDDNNNKIVWNTFINSTFTLIPKYDSSEVKYVCNAGFMIKPCKEVNVIKVKSFLNDDDLNSMKAPAVYFAEDNFIQTIKHHYGW